MSHCFLTGRRRVHPVFPSVSPSVRCSVVFVVRSLVQTVGFFLSSQTTDKKEKESHLSDPLTSDPPSSRFCRSSSGFGPLSGVRVCVQVRGLVCPGVWRTRFLFRPVSPLRSISFSLSHSLARSIARSAWAQTPISVSWRREQTFTVAALRGRSTEDQHCQNQN